MTTRLIEECFELEEFEELWYNDFIRVTTDAVMVILVDPFMINIEDVKHMKTGSIIRARRPAWGRGDLGKYFKVIRR